MEWLAQVEKNGGIIVSVDGIQPEKGNETVYLVRDALTGRVLAAENVTSSETAVMKTLLAPVVALGVKVLGTISDAQESELLAVEADKAVKTAMRKRLQRHPSERCANRSRSTWSRPRPRKPNNWPCWMITPTASSRRSLPMGFSPSSRPPSRPARCWRRSKRACSNCSKRGAGELAVCAEAGTPSGDCGGADRLGRATGTSQTPARLAP